MSKVPSAKNAVLLEVVRDAREERAVAGGQPNAEPVRSPIKCVVSRRRQGLSVVALHVAVETAEDPLEPAVVVGGEAEFLREHLDVRVVVQLRIQPDGGGSVLSRLKYVTLPVSCVASRAIRISRSCTN